MKTTRTIPVEFLYLDLTTCRRCIETGGNLEEAVDRVAPILADIGVELEFRKVHVSNEEDARKHVLEISPTVRINHRDIQPDWEASECGACGDLCCSETTTVECRLWDWDGKTHTAAPVPLLMKAILTESLSGERADEREKDVEVSENLEAFFRSKGRSSERHHAQQACETECGCGPECC